MTDPSQYFKGRTVQEQMNEVIGYVDVRSAEVATDAIAADVAQVHQDMLDADADATAAAASAAAAAGTLANAVKKTGESSQTVEGDITMSTGDLGVAGDVGVQGQLSVLGGCDLRAPVTVATPVNNTDAATKKYVDDAGALKLNITDVNSYALGLTGNQTAAGIKTLESRLDFSNSGIDMSNPPTYSPRGLIQVNTKADNSEVAVRQEVAFATLGNSFNIILHGRDNDGNDIQATLQLTIFRDKDVRLQLIRPNGTVVLVAKG